MAEFGSRENEARLESGHESGNIYCGIGGWTYEPWRGVFYPRACRMRASSRTPPSA